MEEVEVVAAHHECATLRVGDVFLKFDADQARTDVEVQAMTLARGRRRLRHRRRPRDHPRAVELRSLLAIRWLAEHGFDPSSPGCEFDVLRSQL